MSYAPSHSHPTNRAQELGQVAKPHHPTRLNQSWNEDVSSTSRRSLVMARNIFLQELRTPTSLVERPHSQAVSTKISLPLEGNHHSQSSRVIICLNSLRPGKRPLGILLQLGPHSLCSTAGTGGSG
eukprot:7687083-Pyramimonas_sp.AAC.3